MTRHIKVEFETPSCAFVRGYGARDLLVEVRRGRAPVWSRRARAWTCQKSTAMDIVALAEMRGYDVSVTGVRAPVEWAKAPDGALTEKAPIEASAKGLASPPAGLW